MGKLEACTCRFSFSSCFLGSRMLKVCWLELWNTPVLQVLPIQASGNPHACPKGEAGMPQNHIKTSAIESAGWMAASGLSTSHLRQRQRWLFKSFQIQNGLRHVETLGKRTAVKLKDLEAGCVWEGVTSKANNHQKKHIKIQKMTTLIGLQGDISTAYHTVFGSETEYISSLCKHFHALS